MSDGTLFDAREAFADEARGGDLLWSETPAEPIPLRPRSAPGARPPADVTTSASLTPHADPPTGKVARRARAQANAIRGPATASPAGARPGGAGSGGGSGPARGAGAGGAGPARGVRGAGPGGASGPARDGRADAPAAIVPPARKGGPRRLAEPRPTRVSADERGRPLAVDGRAVEGVRESWLVEDRWWTDRPLRRRYWEVVTEDGRDLVVFRELGRGGWYRQRG